MIKKRIEKLEYKIRPKEPLHISVFIDGLGLACSHCSPQNQRQDHAENCPYRKPDRVIIVDGADEDIY